MKKIPFFILMISFILLINCNSREQPKVENNEPAVSKKITPAEVKTLMDGNSAFILVDVRTPEEFRERHIEGAVLIPESQIVSRAESELPDKTAMIVVYCLSGGRSSRAARTLTGMGYEKVFDMGGISGWPYAAVSE